jgi:hypothetical protein
VASRPFGWFNVSLAFKLKDKLLALTAVLELATGLALLIVPSLVSRLLLGTELTGVSIPIARVTGIALIGLGIACWPGCMTVCGMLTYSALVTLYLTYVGVRSEWVGPLLWPAVVVHAMLTLLLAKAWLKPQEDTSS